MSLLPVPRPEQWEHLDVAEAHAVAMHAEVSAAERVTRLLQLARLAGLQQRYDRVRRLVDDAEAVAGDLPPALAHELAVEQLWATVYERRTTVDVTGVLDAGLVLLDECDSEETGARARLLFCVGHCAAWLADPENLARAVDWLGESIGLLRLLDEPELQAEALLTLGYLVYPTQRLYHRAIAALDRSVALLPDGSGPRAVHLTYLGECRVLIGDYAMAERDLAEAHAIGLRVGDERTMGYAAWELARIADIRGDAAGCDRWIAQARMHPGEWFGRSPGNEFLADGVLWAFRQQRADVARERLAELTARGDALMEGVDLGARGLVALLNGDAETAVSLIERHLELGWQETRLWHWQLLLADALLQAGETDRSAAIAAEALHTLVGLGLVDVARAVEPDRWERVMDGLPQERAPRRIHLFGEPAVIDGSGRHPLPHGSPAALIGLLATAQRTLPVDEVCDELWPDASLAVARRRLRNLINRIRSVSDTDEKAPDLVQRTTDGMRIDPTAQVDCLDFEQAARAALRLDPPDVQELQDCLLPHDAGFLPGITGVRIDAQRRRFAQLATVVRRRLIDALIAAGDAAAAAGVADQILADDPFDSDLVEQIARAFHTAGDPAHERLWWARAERIDEELSG